MKITISGTPGSGKSVVGKILAKRLGYSFYDAGQVRREIAENRGMSLEKLNEVSLTDSSSDKIADEITKKVGKTQDDFIFVGRMSYFFIPDAIKIFLSCDLNEAATRIIGDNRRETYSSVEEGVKKLKERIDNDDKRYRKLYGVDYTKGHDVYIDTTNLEIEEVVKKVLDIID